LEHSSDVSICTPLVISLVHSSGQGFWNVGRAVSRARKRFSGCSCIPPLLLPMGDTRCTPFSSYQKHGLILGVSKLLKGSGWNLELLFALLQDKAVDAAETVAEVVADAAGTVMDATGEAAKVVADKAGDAAGYVADKAGDAAGVVADKAGDALDAAGDARDAAVHKTSNVASKAARKAGAGFDPHHHSIFLQLRCFGYQCSLGKLNERDTGHFRRCF
jgi:hypothetical protein